MRMTSLSARSSALALLVALTGLSACSTMKNRSVDSIHQPVVQVTDYVFDTRTDGMGALAYGELYRVQGWFETLNLGYGDRISIEDPTGSATTARQAIGALAGQKGMLVSDTAPATTGAIADGYIRIVVTRSTASVPGCPDWSTQSQTDFAGGTSSNYGCAINSNMAKMIANPQDLVRGRTGSGDLRNATSTRAIRTYEKKEPTGAGELKSASGN